MSLPRLLLGFGLYHGNFFQLGIGTFLLLLFIEPHSARHHQLRGLKKHFYIFFTIEYDNIQSTSEVDVRRLVAAVASATATGAGVVTAPVPARNFCPGFVSNEFIVGNHNKTLHFRARNLYVIEQVTSAL